MAWMDGMDGDFDFLTQRRGNAEKGSRRAGLGHGGGVGWGEARDAWYPWIYATMGHEPTIPSIRAVPARTEEVHQMPTMIVELDTYAARARRAAAKRKRDKAEERRRRAVGYKGWMLKADHKGTGKSA